MKDLWSPADLCDFEEVGFLLFYPEHFSDERDSIEPAAAISVDRLKEGTISGVRLCWSCPKEINDQVVLPNVRRKSGRRPLGVMCGSVESILSVQTENGRPAFHLLVDGKREQPGHVHLGFELENVTSRFKLMRSELVATLIEGYPLQDLPAVEMCCSWIRSRTATHPIRTMHTTI